MRRGEALALSELDNIDLGEDFRTAVSEVTSGKNIYIVGPPGSGKTVMLRKLGLHTWRVGIGSLYVKLEWVKYGWGLADYVRTLGGERSHGIAPTGGDGLVLLDDGELLWSYGGAYRRLVRDLAGRQIAAAFRQIDLDSVREMFGDGVVIYLQARQSSPVMKIPLGLNFLGETREITVI